MYSEAPILVMKFGGSSLADSERINAVTSLIESKLASGIRPVVAASAMGDATNMLVDLARSISRNPHKSFKIKIPLVNILLNLSERI